MGRMTSHILWKIKHVPNHQSDIVGHILWGYSLKFRPWTIGLIYMVGTSNQSVPEMAIDMLINWFADDIFSLWNPHLCQWNPHFLGLIKTVLWSKHGYHVVWSSSVEILILILIFMTWSSSPMGNLPMSWLSNIWRNSIHQCEHSYHTAVGMISQQNHHFGDVTTWGHYTLW